MKKILFILFASLSLVIIALHSQTIPFILMVVFGIIVWLIYSRQKRKLQHITQQNEIATIQLQAASTAPNSQFLFTALAGIQTQIIKHEVEKSAIKTNARIALPMFNETRYVNIPDIIRCEADNTYTKFMLIDGEEILISKTLKEFTDLLTPNGFVRTHQSHLVNISYVKSWLREDGGNLLLIDGTKVPVSKLNRDKLKEILNK